MLLSAVIRKVLRTEQGGGRYHVHSDRFNRNRGNSEEASALFMLILYLLPKRKLGKQFVQGIPENQLFSIGPLQATLSPESHTGPFVNAIDILVVDGTSVLAAADGRIVNVVEIHEEWGPDPSFANKLNYLTIEHVFGDPNAKGYEYTQYAIWRHGRYRTQV